MSQGFRNIFQDLHPLIKLIFDILMILAVFFITFFVVIIIFSVMKNVSASVVLKSMEGGDVLDLRFSQMIYSTVLFIVPPIVVSFFILKRHLFFLD